MSLEERLHEDPLDSRTTEFSRTQPAEDGLAHTFQPVLAMVTSTRG